MITAKIDSTTGFVNIEIEGDASHLSVVFNDFFEKLNSFKPKVTEAKIKGLEYSKKLYSDRIRTLEAKLLKYKNIPLQNLDNETKVKIRYTQGIVKNLKEDVARFKKMIKDLKSKQKWNPYVLKGLYEKYLKELGFKQKSTNKISSVITENYTFNGDITELYSMLIHKSIELNNKLEEKINLYTTETMQLYDEKAKCEDMYTL